MSSTLCLGTLPLRPPQPVSRFLEFSTGVRVASLGPWQALGLRWHTPSRRKLTSHLARMRGPIILSYHISECKGIDRSEPMKHIWKSEGVHTRMSVQCLTEDPPKIPLNRTDWDDAGTRLSSNVRDRFFELSDGDHCHGLFISFFWLIMSIPGVGGTESSFHSFWDGVFGNVALLFQSTINRDSSLGTTTDRDRPDWSAETRGYRLFRGEEKGPETEGDPKDELLRKLSPTAWWKGEIKIYISESISSN